MLSRKKYLIQYLEGNALNLFYYLLPTDSADEAKNYKNDDRAIFVYTFNSRNIDQAEEIVRIVGDEGHRLTFNVYSTTVAGTSPLQHLDTLRKTREKMMELMEMNSETVIYSYYNAEVHTNEKGLDELFNCPYPRVSVRRGVLSGLGETFRYYRSDLTHSVETDCCTPGIDCGDCRHYAPGSVLVTARLDLHAGSEDKFRAWLDYVDTFLSIWVLGYEKGENLYRQKNS